MLIKVVLTKIAGYRPKNKISFLEFQAIAADSDFINRLHFVLQGYLNAPILMIVVQRYNGLEQKLYDFRLIRRRSTDDLLKFEEISLFSFS